MKYISSINLYGKIDLQELKASCSVSALPEKNKVLEYLKKEKLISAYTTEKVFDLFKGKKTNIAVVAYNDETYYWDDRDVYYFENYNLKLNDDFIQHVLNRCNT